jgi:putative DNA primase/helicase
MMPLDIDLIARKLGKATRTRCGWSCLCPAHDDHNPSLSLALSEEGKVLAYCYVGCSFPDIMSALRREGLLGESDHGNHRYTSPKTSDDMALRIWRESVCAEGTLVETYLRSRGIEGSIPPTLRFHPRLFHASRTYHPAMVAAVALWPNQTVSGVHRTYLTAEGGGKAPLSPNKMMLGPTKGGAVRLGSPGSKLILAEGIETALSCLYATNIPTWSCLSTSGMRDVVVPPFEVTQDIIICMDGDSAGKKAASTLAERVHRAGYGVRIAPSPQGQDFNDILRR